MMTIRHPSTAAAVLALALLAGPALAVEVQPLPDAKAQAAAPPVEMVAPAETDAVLESLSGRGIVVALTEQDLTAVSSGNTITAANVGSGSINMQDNALSGFAGVGNFMMNTGHNNNLQSSMSVTIIVTQ